MARKKKEKKVMVIGSMVVSVDGDADIGKGNEYEMTTTHGKPWLPKLRSEVEYEEMEPRGEAADGTPIMKPVVQKRKLTQCQSYMHFVWDIFEDTEGSKMSSYINFWIMLLIVCSAIVAVVETIPSIHKSQEQLWFTLEALFVSQFTVEFVARLISCPDKFLFFTTIMNYIDLVAIIPFYMDIIAKHVSSGSDPPNFGFLRILRLSRAARLIKLSKYSQGIRLVSNAMSNSIDALQLFALLLTLVLVVFSSGIYYTERGEWVDASAGCPEAWYDQFCNKTNDGGEWVSPDTGMVCVNTCITNRYYRNDTQVGGEGRIEEFPSPFQSIPQSFWWCIVTLTTVGYGDMYPYSVMGKIVGVLTMLVGLIMLALPLSIIGTNFIEERNIMVEENKRRDEEERKAKVVRENPTAEPGEEEEKKSKSKMRKDLREVLAKADQLYVSTGTMAQQLERCAEILKEMREYKVRREGSSAPASGQGAGTGEGTGDDIGAGDVTLEMTQHVPVYAVPVPAMEELKRLCLAVLQTAISEMKIWDPQGELPEMPVQILELLQLEKKPGVSDGDRHEYWKQRLAAYESVVDEDSSATTNLTQDARMFSCGTGVESPDAKANNTETAGPESPTK